MHITTSPHQARGSVLVLVMTLLGILFVVGVAFMATMNFEADMISAERQRSQNENGMDTAMAASAILFGGTSVTTSEFSFAELPGVQNAFSPIEPYYVQTPGNDDLFNTADDEQHLAWSTYFDAQAQSDSGSAKSPQPGFFIDTQGTNGAEVWGYSVRTFDAGTDNWVTTPVNLLRCADGPNRGNVCSVPGDCLGYPCEGKRLADADGDGIVDSLLVDASAQLSDLASVVNPASNPSGKVSLALRVVPHGGMVNLNESHPLLIQGIFDLPPASWPLPTDKNVDPNIGFRHGPTQDLAAYSPTLEEPALRRRGIIPPREFQPSLLHGNPLAADAASTGAHMPKQLFWWSRAGHQDVFSTVGPAKKGHRFSPFSPTELYPEDTNFYYWPVMMEPSTANEASPLPPWNGGPNATGMSYDRRHLATTVSHDDLLARPAKVSTARGQQDLRRAMLEANWPPPGWNEPNVCETIVPFEYVYYPSTGLTGMDCCKEDADCVPDTQKGRLKLSMSWIDDELAAANSTSLSVPEQDAYRARIYRTIHDVFFMLVRNAAQATEVEGMTCEIDRDCPITDTVCLLNDNPVPAGEKGYCVHLGHPNKAAFSNPALPKGPGCGAGAGCGIPGSICRTDGICTLSAPAWRDVVCTVNTDCDSSEFCRPRCQGGVNAGLFCAVPADCPNSTCGPAGMCADRWTRQPRGEALVSRTAASLTANMIDFVDADNVPTRIAIRDFDFTRPNTAGREVDVADPPSGQRCDNDAGCPPAAPVCSMNKECIKPIYVYGLERQPYITEVTVLNGPDPFPIEAWGIEVFNPYELDFSADNPTEKEEYFLYEVNPMSGVAFAHKIELSGILRGTLSATGPFTTYYSKNPAVNADDLLGSPRKGQALELTGLNLLSFKNNWIIYLVRRVDYATGPDPGVAEIVVDQFRVKGDVLDHIGKEGPAEFSGLTVPPELRFTLERVVSPNSPWTAPIPIQKEGPQGHASLGDWNATAIDNTVHPVEVNFANTGLFGSHTGSTVAPSFPTTGSLSLLMRHANRAVDDYAPPTSFSGSAGTVTNLAFTTELAKNTVATARSGVSLFPTKDDMAIAHFELIDNGRLPLFDTGKDFGAPWGWHYAHHLSPALFKAWDPDPSSTVLNRSNRPLPGDLNTLPWGQLVFDYFTALPLSNGGPYDIDPSPAFLSLKDMPRVDQGGLRVHGRININAAPWKVLSGLPLVPLEKFNAFPTTLVDKIKRAYVDPLNLIDAQPIGSELAQAMVAYREARSIPDPADPTGMTSLTGNYDDGPPLSGTPPTTFGRGWTNAAPKVRRGTGFMGVGELANVRHGGALAGGGPPPTSPYRIDAGVIGSDAAGNKNNEDFIDAAAVLIALGDWVSVRSHVFTVYGQIRGLDDPGVAALYTDPAQRAAAVLQDTDSRAIRFQETIDRLPVLQGQPRPQRIGQRTVGRYTDVNSD